MGYSARPHHRGTHASPAFDRVDVRARHLPSGHYRHCKQHGRANDTAASILTMLDWTIYSSLIGTAVLMLLPRNDARTARGIALLTAIAGFLIALAGIFTAKPGEVQTISDLSWIP